MPLRFIDNAAFTSRVGIGTNNPTSPLHVFNAGYPQMALESNGGTWQVGVSTGNDLAFRRGTSGSNYPLWLDSSDNVGIGTTNPGAKLDVNGNISINAGQKIQLSGSSDSTHHIYHDSSTDYDKVNYSSGFQLEHNVSGIQFALVGGTGNVGIGTTSPDAKLQVAGDFRLGDGAYTSIDFNADPSSHQGNGGLEIKPSTVPGSGTSNWYTRFASKVSTGTTNHNVTIDGNVGIGTTTPGQKLHVQTTSGVTARFAYDSNNYQDLNWEGSNIVGGSHTFKIAGSEKMRIDSGGKVLIGVTSNQTQSKLNSRQDGSSIELI